MRNVSTTPTDERPPDEAEHQAPGSTPDDVPPHLYRWAKQTRFVIAGAHSRLPRPLYYGLMGLNAASIGFISWWLGVVWAAVALYVSAAIWLRQFFPAMFLGVSLTLWLYVGNPTAAVVVAAVGIGLLYREWWGSIALLAAVISWHYLDWPLALGATLLLGAGWFLLRRWLNEREKGFRIEHPDEIARSELIVGRWGALMHKGPIDVKQAVRQIKSGVPLYGVTHPLFTGIPLAAAALAIGVVYVYGTIQDTDPITILWGWTGLAILGVTMGWFTVKAIKWYLYVVVLDERGITTHSGFFRRRAPYTKYDRILTWNPIPPLRGLEWLHFASFAPETAGDEENPEMKHIKNMEDLIQVMLVLEASMMAADDPGPTIITIYRRLYRWELAKRDAIEHQTALLTSIAKNVQIMAQHLTSQAPPPAHSEPKGEDMITLTARVTSGQTMELHVPAGDAKKYGLDQDGPPGHSE